MPDVTATMQPLTPLGFEEAEAFWADKVKLTPSQYRQLRDDAKTRAFAVSGIAKMDVLADFYRAIEQAIADGTAFSDFKQAVREHIERRGWTGKRAWRVDNIFRTNVMTAYSVGKWSQLMEAVPQGKDGEGKDVFVMYDAVGDSRTRPTHAAMDGKVFAANDSIWDTWWPPNGFRCRCTTRQLSAAEVKARGLKVEHGRDVLDQPVEVGPGQWKYIVPDPGFAHNPGKVMFGALDQKAGRPTEMTGLRGPADYRRRQAHNIRPAELTDLPESDLLPEGLPDGEYWKAFRKAFGIDKGGETVVTDVLGEPVIVSDDMFLTTRRKSKIGKSGHGSFVKTFPSVLKQPYEVWLTPMQYPDGRIELRKRYVQIWRTTDKQRVAGTVILEVERGRWVGTTAFSPEHLDYVDRRLRKGVMLHARK